MPKLVMMRGLPASGKSTRAKQILEAGNTIRVNRDLLRTMLHCDKWNHFNEDQTILAEKALVRDFMTRGFNVVVDDTNLNPKNEGMWKSIAEDVGGRFVVEDIVVPFDECVRRDALRSNGVGRDVIVGMALQWNLFPVPDKGIVLCDLDGTLCDIQHRLKYGKGEEKDWKKFFAGIPDDTLRLETLNLIVGAKEMGHKVFFVSARPETHRKETIEWLDKHLPSDDVFHYEGLIMRRAGDRRDDVLVKQEIYDRYFKNMPIKFVVDDRPKVIRMWQKNGLEVVDMGSGEEF